MLDLRPRLAYLVADDSPIVAGLVAELLVETGVAVVGPAGDGREALRLYRQARPDGAVLDFDMPHANGLEVLQAIRAEQGSRPCVVIMLTANDDASLRDACLAAGADHFLHKATDFERLQDILRAHAAATAVGDPRQQSPDGPSAN
jgi:CheY-like chemotaxis protein